MYGNQRKARRSGFTLIELLVVIAIIAVLVGLLSGAVILFMSKGPEVQNRNDLLAIQQGLQTFKAEKGQYPPHIIRLRANMADYNLPTADALDKLSASFLRSVMWKNLPANTNLQWAGPGTNFAATFPSGVVLDGDQCLVFFLMGPPNAAGNAGAGMMGGFSNNPANPVDGQSTLKRYMDIPNVSRLTNRSGHAFPSYLDVYGTQPFVYLSSGNRPNGYTSPPTIPIVPYFKTPGKFHNSDSFQLISAGADMVFGPGGQWGPPAATGAGADDISNFSSSKLGVLP